MKTKKVTPTAAAKAIKQMLQTMAHNGHIQASENKSPNEYTLNFVSKGIIATFHLQSIDMEGGRSCK